MSINKQSENFLGDGKMTSLMALISQTIDSGLISWLALDAYMTLPLVVVSYYLKYFNHKGVKQCLRRLEI